MNTRKQFNLNIIYKLIKQLNKINTRDKYGNTILIHCAKYASSKTYYILLEKLIELKADLNLQNQNGETALICAALYSNTTSSIEAVKLLLKSKADDTIVNTFGETAFHCAVMYSSYTSSIDTVKILMRKKTMNIPDFNQNTPLISSILFQDKSSFETTKLLVESRANLNHRDIYGNTALMYCSTSYDLLPIAKLLIKHNANVHIRNTMNDTALINACYYNNEKIIPYLLNKKANVNYPTFGHTPLIITTNISICKMLINAGANINAKDVDGIPLIIKEIQALNIPKIKLLIKHNVDLNNVDKFGQTGLFYSTNNKLSKYLIDSGLNPKIQDNNGNNVLMNNILNNKEFYFYIKYSDLNAQNNEGLTAYDILKMKNPYSKYLHHLNIHTGKTNCYNKKDKNEDIFSVREYSYKNQIYKIDTITIPKGTILFRGTLNVDDKCGIKSDNEYCSYKNLSLFFYFYPFYSEEYTKDKMNAYYTTETLVFVNLTCPSELTHSAKFDDNIFNSCDIIESKICKKYTGRKYDICFTKDFLKMNPDIMGYIGISRIDIAVNNNKYNDTPIPFYSTMWADAYNFGIPEIALYPTRERTFANKIMTKQECNKQRFNFKLLFSEVYPTDGTIPNKYIDSPFVKKLKSYLSPNAKQHITIYKPIMTFVMYEMLDDKKNCIPISYPIDAKLLTFQNDIYTNSGIHMKNKKFDKTLKNKIRRKYLKTRKIR